MKHWICACPIAVFTGVLAMGLSAVPARAQTSANGAIRGYVKDSTGSVLPETTITAVSSTAPTPFTAVSDREGYYRLLELPHGEYELKAERPSFAKFARAGILVRAGLNLAVDIDMVLSSQTETIVVKADTPMLESSNAVQAINTRGEFQRSLPLTSRRDWADSLGLAPGVVSTQNAAGNVFYQDQRWNGNKPPGGTTSAFEIAQPDVSLGGPIFKNRVWFFSAYRYTNDSLGVSRTSTQLANLRALVPGFQPLAMSSEASYYFGKVTAQIAPSPTRRASPISRLTK